MPNSKKRKNVSNIKHPETFSVTRRFLWLKQNFAYCLAISAVVWIVGLSYYIEHFIGWGSVLALNPADFGPFILSITLPLLTVWFILAYIERSSSLDANAELFQSYINSLMYPDEGASQSAKAFATALQEQIKLLQQENKQVVTQSAQLKTDLDNRVEELSKILSTLDLYSSKTLNELNDGVKNLANRCSYITDKTNNTVSNMRDCTAQISQNSDIFLGKITPILDEISAVSSNIKNNIADNKINLSEIKTQLEACANLSKNQIEEMLMKISDNSSRIENAFYKMTDEYDSLYKRLDTSISGIEGRVEEQQRLIHTQNNVLDHNSEILNNKLTKYGKTLSSEIDKLVKNSVEMEKMTKKQISALKAVNVETGKTLNGIGNSFDQKRAELEQRCEYAVNSMQNVIIAINKETEKLMTFTSLTQAKNMDLQNISETIVDKIGDVSSKLALKTDTLKDKAVEVIGKFTEASELINRSTDKMSTSSSLIVNNSQQGVRLLEEQSFYINNAMTNVEVISEKLNKLNSDIKKASEDIALTMSNYSKQINRYEHLQEDITPFETNEPEFDEEKLIQTANHINKFLAKQGIKTEKLFNNADMLDLWENYLTKDVSIFNEILTSTLSKKQIFAIRKSFDDNADFHNLVIRYLFLMDILIKEISNPLQNNKDNLINFSVNYALDKTYFILLKALNNAD
ncbi:MAG: hypothetical protein NC218_10100 [Acetobacter sp.]|nr:hypothetical protein [Acetobacter sp.]